VACKQNASLGIIDLNTGVHTFSILGIEEPQAAVYTAPPVSPRPFLFVTDANGLVRIFDPASPSYPTLGSFSYGEDADCDDMHRDESRNLIYVAYGNQAAGIPGSIGVIDPNKGLPVKLADASVQKFDAHPEGFAWTEDAKKQTMWVNMPAHQWPDGELGAVVSINSTVTGGNGALTYYRLPKGYRNPFPMEVIEELNILIIAVRVPPLLMVLDSRQPDKVLGQFATVTTVDDMFYDEDAKRVYLTGADSGLCAHEMVDDKGTKWKLVANITTAPFARTGLLVPEQGRFFVGVPQSPGQVAGAWAFKTRK